MNKQELIEKYEKKYSGGSVSFAVAVLLTEIQKYLKQLHEPQKPVVPQFVAEWIEKGKKELNLRDLMSSSYTSTEVGNWLGELDEDGGFKNQETFARAVLDGYEVEKDKRYLVKVKGHIHENILVYGYGVKRYFFSSSLEGNRRAKHTRKELEQAGFGWVFDCEGIEIEEVEG